VRPRALNPTVSSRSAARQAALVVVEYGQHASEPLMTRLLSELPAHAAQRIERVRTDIAPGRVLAQPNEAFEFSGYQEGLQRLLGDTTWAGDEATPKVIVFVNDTITTSHATALTSYAMSQLLTLDLTRVQAPALVGLTMKAQGAILAASGGLGYASTYAFALVGTLAQLRKVRFYEPREVAARFVHEVLPHLPRAYVESVGQWLEPANLLSGWHNAIPGHALSAETRLRKQLAIHLEHTMPARLQDLGFAFIDLGTLLPTAQRWRLRLLRQVDRLYINRLKLGVRLPHLLGLAK